jgi:hypothetical protein
MEVIMDKIESLMVLWKYIDLSEKKRLMHEFTRTHGEHFSNYEFFEFLANKYDDSQIEFESGEDESSEKVAA